MRSGLRFVPLLIAGALLALPLLVRAPAARTGSGAGTDAFFYPTCNELLQSGGRTDSITVAAGLTLTQPFDITANVAACSVTFASTYAYSFPRLEFVQWDPMTLTPDPTTVALRTRGFTPSDLQYNRIRTDFITPIILRRGAGLADPPRATQTALRLTNVPYYSNVMQICFQGEGAATTPAAYVTAPGGPALPLAGAHPLLSHAICGGDGALQSLYLMQSVMTTSELLPGTPFEFLQRFRVPVRTELGWIELAFGPYSGIVGNPITPVVAILDNIEEPLTHGPLPTPLVQAILNMQDPTSHWDSHFDFDYTITLEPGRDYWLLARAVFRYRLYARTLNGTEGPDFTSRIGPLITRDTETGEWTAATNRALSFRLIGKPVGVLDAPPAPPSRSALRLTVTPNPARGVAFVAWSGARGGVRFEVLDARGRRVAGGSGSGGGEGRWAWPAAQENGRPLVAGVYFVRVTDAEGHRATERVVLVR